jgi:uncharacterized protein YutD
MRAYNTQDNLLKIPKSDIHVLRGQFSNVVRVLPIVMKFKIALMNKVIKKFSNEVVFSNRYDQLIKRYDYIKKHRVNDEYV